MKEEIYFHLVEKFLLEEGAEDGQALLLEKKKWWKRGISFGETGISKVLQLYKRSSRIILLSISISSNDKEEEALIMNMNELCHRLSGCSESQVIESWRQSRGKDFRFLLLVWWVNKIRWRRTNSN